LFLVRAGFGINQDREQTAKKKTVIQERRNWSIGTSSPKKEEVQSLTSKVKKKKED